MDSSSEVCSGCVSKGLSVCESCDKVSDKLYREGDFQLCLYCRAGAMRDKDYLSYSTGNCKVCKAHSNRIIDGLCPLHYYQNAWSNDTTHKGNCRSCNEYLELNSAGKCSRCYVGSKLQINAPTLAVPTGQSICGSCHEFKSNPEATCWDCAHTCVECGSAFLGLEREDKLCAECFKLNSTLSYCRVCSSDKSRSWNSELAVCSEECKAKLFEGYKFQCVYCKVAPTTAPYELCTKCDELSIICPSCEVTVIGATEYVCMKCLRVNETKYRKTQLKSEESA